VNITKLLHQSIKGAQSRYFELFWPHTKLPLNGRKLENNCLIRKKNIREIMTNYKGTRMAKDGLIFFVDFMSNHSWDFP